MSNNLTHLLTLANRGKHPGSSGGEKQARKIVTCILNHSIGLDGSATEGIAELVQLNHEGREIAKKVAGIR